MKIKCIKTGNSYIDVIVIKYNDEITNNQAIDMAMSLLELEK